MIRKGTKQDFDFIYKLYMHPAINPYLLYEQMSKEEFEPIYADLVAKGIKYLYYDAKKPTGMFKLVPQLYRNSHIAYLGGVAVHPDFAGKGAGQKMLNDILAFAKQQGFLRVELSVATFNTKAIHIYEKCGFEKEGVLRNFTYLKSENRFIDEVIMSYLSYRKSIVDGP